MYDISAEAYQTRSGIYVTITGMLADSCSRARISGIYPGNIFHITDPGHAEVFIEEWKETGGFCTDALVPWEQSVLIRDFDHNQVAILVNGKQELVVNVEGGRSPLSEEKEWIVIALVGMSDRPPFWGCSIRHKDSIYPRIYRRVFGPDTRIACAHFLRGSCGRLQDTAEART
jgi:hypothetical protein